MKWITVCIQSRQNLYLFSITGQRTKKKDVIKNFKLPKTKQNQKPKQQKQQQQQKKQGGTLLAYSGWSLQICFVWIVFILRGWGWRFFHWLKFHSVCCWVFGWSDLSPSPSVSLVLTKLMKYSCSDSHTAKLENTKQIIHNYRPILTKTGEDERRSLHFSIIFRFWFLINLKCRELKGGIMKESVGAVARFQPVEGRHWFRSPTLPKFKHLYELHFPP